MMAETVIPTGSFRWLKQGGSTRLQQFVRHPNGRDRWDDVPIVPESLLAPEPEPPCWCSNCHEREMAELSLFDRLKNQRMHLCPACGNKRCPRATDHRLACTGSNDPGQLGSNYGTPLQELRDNPAASATLPSHPGARP